MKPMLSLVLAAATAIALMPVSAKAQDYPNYGSVTYHNQGTYQNRSNPIYTPGVNFTNVAPNGAINAYYIPGHPAFANDRGPAYYKPGFRSYYQAPGSLHYYYGMYNNRP